MKRYIRANIVSPSHNAQYWVDYGEQLANQMGLPLDQAAIRSDFITRAFSKCFSSRSRQGFEREWARSYFSDVYQKVAPYGIRDKKFMDWCHKIYDAIVDDFAG